MAERLALLSIICFVLAGVFLVVALILWFSFKIPAVIGDLTGRTARKSIAQMRAANEKSGKTRRESKAGAAQGSRCGDPRKSGTPGAQPQKAGHDRPETGLLMENQMDGYATEETAVLQDVSTVPDGETTSLLAEEEETASLVPPRQNRPACSGGTKLTMVDEVILVDTDEKIE